jgi:hypothetical protein
MDARLAPALPRHPLRSWRAAPDWCAPCGAPFTPCRQPPAADHSRRRRRRRRHPHPHHNHRHHRPAGDEELWSLGQRLRARFPSVSQAPYFPKRYPILSTQVSPHLPTAARLGQACRAALTRVLLLPTPPRWPQVARAAQSASAFAQGFFPTPASRHHLAADPRAADNSSSRQAGCSAEPGNLEAGLCE